jgi:SOS response regulatory protein OraA/RecX
MKFMENFEEAEKIDKLRAKMLKYILYKKRTEMEVRQKFCEEDENAVEDAIEYFKELKYIDDFSYIERSIAEYTKLKNLSIKEINYKLLQKGIDKKEIDEYIYKNREMLLKYEITSAQNIWNKKIQNSDEETVKNFLYKKGYMQETINIIHEDN